MARPYSIASDDAKARRKIKSKAYKDNIRRDPIYRARNIGIDSRRWDKKRGLTNDLTVEAIQQLIDSGCSYCNNATSRITLDRIDNSKGHTADNVVSACYRCNMIRGSMPYEAWLALVPAVRDISVKGLFGTWVGGPWGQTAESQGVEPCQP